MNNEALYVTPHFLKNNRSAGSNSSIFNTNTNPKILLSWQSWFRQTKWGAWGKNTPSKSVTNTNNPTNYEYKYGNVTPYFLKNNRATVLYYNKIYTNIILKTSYPMNLSPDNQNGVHAVIYIFLGGWEMD